MGMLRYQDNGRSRKQREKSKSAKQLREEAEAAKQFAEMNKKWASQRFSSKPIVKGESTLSIPSLQVPATKTLPGVTINRGAQVLPLKDLKGPMVGAVKAPQQYSGTKVLGISTLHKSNAVPVFKEEDIIDIARMRR